MCLSYSICRLLQALGRPRASPYTTLVKPLNNSGYNLHVLTDIRGNHLSKTTRITHDV